MCRRAFRQWIKGSLRDLHKKVDRIMTQQEKLDAYVARIDTALAGVAEDVRVLKEQHPEVDFSALEAKVTALEALDAENPEAPPA